MSDTTRARYKRTAEICERTAAEFGFIRGGGLGMGESAFNRAVDIIAAVASVTRQTARKHLDRYVFNLPARKWGREFKNKPKATVNSTDEKGE